MKKIFITIVCLVYFSCFFIQQTQAQCFTDKLTTAAFATGGTSIYKNNIIWLTWGAQSASDIFGKAGVTLKQGEQSRASIDLGGGNFLCIEATLNIGNGNKLTSYIPGNFSGDSMDDMYNIGGTGSNNKLVSGILVNGGTASFSVTCTATLNGVPIKLAGMIIADAESLSSVEHFSCTATGIWDVIEVRKNSGQGTYNVSKTANTTNGITTQTINFLSGNDNKTSANSFLSFSPAAYDAKTFAVNFSVTETGSGATAIALGIIPSGVDGGDAPQSYGAPLHVIPSLIPSDDGIPVNGNAVNLNTNAYTSGKLSSASTDFLGTVAPDADTKPLFSKDALGDDNSPTIINDAGQTVLVNPGEEDAWPVSLKSISYKNYKPGDKIIAVINYKASADSFISGWIDFDLNGQFDESERVTIPAPASNTQATVTWTIPANRKVKSTYLRLRFARSRDDILSPTSFVTGGEVEDHRLFIIVPAISNPVLPNKAPSINY